MVAEVWQIPVDHIDPEAQIVKLLEKARAEGKHVSIAGAQHSMGGHTIYFDGIVINMLSWDHMEVDEKRHILNVQAGEM